MERCCGKCRWLQCVAGSPSGRCTYPMPDWLKRSVLRGATNGLDDVQYMHWGTDCPCFERKEMGHE